MVRRLSGLTTVPWEHLSADNDRDSSCLREHMHRWFFGYVYVCVCCMRVNVDVICHPKDIRSTYACLSVCMCMFIQHRKVWPSLPLKRASQRYIQTSLQEAQATLSDFVGTQVTGRDGIVQWKHSETEKLKDSVHVQHAVLFGSRFHMISTQWFCCCFLNSRFEGHVWQLSLRQRGSRAVQDWSWSWKTVASTCPVVLFSVL